LGLDFQFIFFLDFLHFDLLELLFDVVDVYTAIKLIIASFTFYHDGVFVKAFDLTSPALVIEAEEVVEELK
jgi:hypothetical protein